MQKRETAIFLQSLQGSQALVALAYLLIRRAMTIEELSAVTGKEHKTVRSAVKGMAAKDLLFKQVGAHGKETWLPAGDTFFGQLMSQNAENWQTGSNVVDDGVSESHYKTPASLLLIKGQNAEKRDSGEIVSVTISHKTPEEEKECLAALHAAGIFGGKAEKLALLDWVDPDYIKAHVTAAKGEDFDRPVGMAIYRMETNQPAPELQENGHLVGCGCTDCYLAKEKARNSMWDEYMRGEE